MRFGLTTPIVTLTPTGHGAWERDAGPAEIKEIAVAADRLGYHHLTCSEHVAIPKDVVATRGGRYYDPLATFGWLAAFTERVRFATHVVVLPYHHPLAVAKRYGTLDRICDGRLILGVGVGSLEPEFELLGVDFAGRGQRYEDALRALRAVLGEREPVYRGTHYEIEGFVVDPPALQRRVPLWLGGRTPRSLRRALELADGWDPFYLTIDELAALLGKARTWPAWRARAERGEPFDLVFSPERVFDVARPDGRGAMLALLARYRDLGATALNLRFASTSLAHLLEQLEAFSRDVAPEV